ncbi:MAG: hypothetical protein A3D44_03145 [Candidatus Staskawiczbacteria bacterium RIFCSPHIGHO2_02_FULL_42_22]|uniref:SCP domain-containing protein n=1 Tax=Candidatus Staskawiczbacteria bacterium RIFCSPHIGHO2_02_FULL_42_22 TaxID=1802207 RepID=A0A1G2I5B9_9BACT|nr:MAG: hypothetical protein A3D44_03145 [Candidatus Staskawiczbacteria bacterium RIFCSPHIGHO2_02_FULL_42_22]
MKKIVYIPILLLLLAGLRSGFYFKGAVLDFYNNAAKNLEHIQQGDFGIIVSMATKNIFTPPPLNIGGQENNAVFVKANIIAQTNIQRFNNGNFPPLMENAKLSAAARAKAEDMFKNQYFEHISPSGVDPGTLVKSFGYEYIVSGENLILGNFADEKELVQAWMDSPGHRANILHNRFTEIGVAVVKGIYQGRSAWISVQEFGLPLSVCPEPPVSAKQKIENNKITLTELEAQINTKRQEINNTNPRSSQYNAKVDEYNNLVAQYNQLANSTKDLIVNYNSQINAFNECVVGN